MCGMMVFGTWVVYRRIPLKIFKLKISAIPIPSIANIEDYMAWSSSMQACISPTWLILG